MRHLVLYGNLPYKFHSVHSLHRVHKETAMNGSAARARIEARLDRQQKKAIERAAALEGRTVTDFVVTSAQAEAARVIEAHTRMVLSERDQTAFVSALLNPAVPTGRLARAAARYKQVARQPRG